MHNEQMRCDKVLALIDNDLGLETFQDNAVIREVYLQVEVMREQARIRTLEYRLRCSEKRNKSFEEKLKRIYDKRLETVDGDFAQEVRAAGQDDSQQGDNDNDK